VTLFCDETMGILNLFILFGALVLCCFAAITDLQQRRIPNLLVLAVIALAFIRMDMQFDSALMLGDIKWAALVLVGGLILWRLHWLGGGDVKFIFAGALLVGASALTDYLVLTILLGGLLGILAFGDMWLEKHYGWSTGLAFPRADMAVRTPDAPLPRKASVPYGIAVSLSCVVTLLIHSTVSGWH
jgi:prepilin peptidase CpaA